MFNITEKFTFNECVIKYSKNNINEWNISNIYEIMNWI